MFTFRTKLTLLTLLPLLVLIAGVTFFAIHQSARLSGVQSEILKDGLLQAKKAELKNYMELSYTAIRDIYEDPTLSREEAQGLVADAFHRMEYGSDGYFFVYDYGACQHSWHMKWFWFFKILRPVAPTPARDSGAPHPAG